MLEYIFEEINKYIAPREFCPFKVIFKMDAPMALSHPWLHFDGILAHLLLRKILKEAYYTLPTNLPIDFFKVLDLPLKQAKNKEMSIYHSSISFFDIKEIYIKHIFKRFHERDLHFFKNERIKKIYITSGKFKNYKIQIPYTPSTKVIFYGNGNISEIEKLLKGLSGLGKKTAIGYGFINDFKIHEIKSDLSIIDDNNIAMRPIPIDFITNKNEIEKTFLGYKFPYWSKSNVTLCAIPGEKIWIKSG